MVKCKPQPKAPTPIRAFLDKDRKPFGHQIANILGARKPLWDCLLEFITSHYGIPPELNYGGRNYGRNPWYRKSGRTLVSLYAQDGHFVAQLVLGTARAAEARRLKLGMNARQPIESTPQLHDGRWLFLRVHTEKDVRDVEALLHIKKRPRPSSPK